MKKPGVHPQLLICYLCCLFQPVYLLLWLKKGKGNSLSYDSQSSIARRRQLSKVISINGEMMDFNNEGLNIHDYANFEKSEDLIPEFRLSIKSKGGSLTRQQRVADDKTCPNGSEESLRRKAPSFQNIARQVRLMESALLKWQGRRPRSRHHSSSSEDMVDSVDSDNDSRQADEDKVSVNTDVSDVPVEESEVGLEVKDEESPKNGNQTSFKTEIKQTESEPRQRKSAAQSSDVIDNVVNKDARPTHMHEKPLSVHEHGSVPRPGRKKRRCPYCVVL